MLDKIKILLGLSNTEEQDEILETLVSLCKDEAIDFCNLEAYNNKLDSAVIQMVIERYNKLGTEGLTGVSTNGIKEEHIDGYSETVLSKLRKNRKVKCV